jgi:hypothetical protein
MIMARPRFEAGNSQARKVRPSSVLNSTSRRVGKALTAIAFFRERIELKTNDGMMVVVVKVTGPLWLV